MKREEAIEVYNGLINTKIKEAFEFFAPELRESEDEKIRKELIGHCKDLIRMSQDDKVMLSVYEPWLAYLEKQKGLTTENNMISSKKCNKSPLTDEAFKEQLERVLRNNVLDTDIRITGDTVIGAKQKEQRSADNVSIEEHIKGFKALCDDLSKPSIDSGKQKEQNGGIEECTDFTIYHPLKNGKGEYECIPYSFYGSLTSFSEDKDLIDFLRTCFYTKEECNEWIERQKEQKPISEVFGFKVGDAVRLKDGDGRKHIIKSIEEVEGIHGPNFYNVEFEDNSARDGIYLCEEYLNGYYTQMEKIEEEQKLEEEDHITPNKKFFQWIYDRLVFIHGENPDVDYMRSLKDRIKEMSSKQKPAEWSEKDKMNLNGCICSLHQYGYMTYADFLKHLPERFNLQPKQEWSEEDEEMRNLIIAIFEVNHPDGFFKANELGTTDMRGVHTKEIISWLKSLRPQPKQEWSEEDEKRIQRICDFLWKNRKGDTDTIYQIEKDVDWLKSLRPSWKPSEQEKGKESRKDWKPSEEQMDALWTAKSYYGRVWACDIQRALESLYEQLEKLM